MGGLIEGDIVRYIPADITGLVLQAYAKCFKLLTAEGERTFCGIENFEKVNNPDHLRLEIYPQQKALNHYLAAAEAGNPAAGALFRLLMGEMFKLVGPAPGAKSWLFLDERKGQEHVAIRVPVGRTSNIFHLWAGERITITLEPGKKCPEEYQKYFPKKKMYYGKDSKDLEGGELNEETVTLYAKVLESIYRANVYPAAETGAGQTSLYAPATMG